MGSLSSGEGVFALLGGLVFLLLTSGLLLFLEGRECSSESAILLCSQVNGCVSLVFEFSSCGIDSLFAQHGKGLSDVLSHHSDHRKLNLGLGGDFLDAKLLQSFLYHINNNI